MLKSYDFTCSSLLVLEAEASITVHDPLGQVDVPVLILALNSLEPGTQDGLVVALNVETNILGGLEEV